MTTPVPKSEPEPHLYGGDLIWGHPDAASKPGLVIDHEAEPEPEVGLEAEL